MQPKSLGTPPKLPFWVAHISRNTFDSALKLLNLLKKICVIWFEKVLIRRVCCSDATKKAFIL
jgi:hypothetical protein